MKLPKSSLLSCFLLVSALFTGGTIAPVLSAIPVSGAVQTTDKLDLR